MDDFAAIFGAQPITRLSRRLSRRQLEEEARIAESPPNAGRERGISEHIPSPLIPLHERVRALAVGGAPAWSRRLKLIHDLTTAARETLHQEWITLARIHQGNPSRFAAAWTERAARADFSQVNDLIDRHNRYFPAEANLAMDVHTRDYVGFGGGDYRLRYLGTTWVLEHFQADLDMASRSPNA